VAPPRNIRFARSKDAIGRDLDIARARKEFFPNRPDVSDDRALRRQQLADQTASFKGQFTKPVMGGNPNSKVTGLVQMTSNAPRTLSQEKQRLSNIFGPTPGEIAGDFTRALGNIGQSFGVPFVGGAMRLGEGIKNLGQKGLDFVSQFLPNVDMGGVSNFFQPAETNLNARILALSPTQRQFYDRLVSDTTQNISVQEALRRAEAMGMAMGGIATLR
jgi:hypothetical protein|tara:strand:+ start:592 stop:1242 length:651 start_codon:yes stop_codon:yes gene_type:complete